MAGSATSWRGWTAARAGSAASVTPTPIHRSALQSLLLLLLSWWRFAILLEDEFCEKVVPHLDNSPPSYRGIRERERASQRGSWSSLPLLLLHRTPLFRNRPEIPPLPLLPTASPSRALLVVCRSPVSPSRRCQPRQ